MIEVNFFNARGLSGLLYVIYRNTKKVIQTATYPLIMKQILFALSLLFAFQVKAQELTSNDPLVNDAFQLAVRTVDINTRRGILAAGGDYGGEWTRDIAINSWNAASLLRPKVAEKSLWSVTIQKDSIGHQYWDKIIWVIAAWQHYQINGDKVFLKQAYACSVKTMKQLEIQVFDSKYGLFMGPSVFNDGIAAYPEPIYEPNNYSSAVTQHKNSAHIKCLSTNAIYYGAYQSLREMARQLEEPQAVAAAYQEKAVQLKSNILKYLYDMEQHKLNYLIDQNGKVDTSQEGLGISFAVLFRIVDGENAKKLIQNAVVSKYGITSIYPDFPRYSAQKPGRHNNIIWPMVNGFFAKAAIQSANYTTFTNELFNQTHLALDADKGDYNFREVYNPYTGKPDGGFQHNETAQPDFHWESSKLQTWSATAYLNMLLNGIFGLRFKISTLGFSPYLPEGIHFISLKDLSYRKAILDITIKGSGKAIQSFMLDGKLQSAHQIVSNLTGKHKITILMK